MDCFRCIEQIAISNELDEIFRSLCFDGEYFYFTMPQSCLIIKYDRHFKKVECLKTSREYNCICYDINSKCFWASVVGCCKELFKLNGYFDEMERITLKIEGMHNHITGLSFNCCKDRIIVSTCNKVYEVSKYTGDCLSIYKEICGAITEVTSICPGCLIVIMEGNNQYVCILNHLNQIKKCIKICCKHVINSMVFNPCDKEGCGELYCLVAESGCCPCIIIYQFDFHQIGFKLCKCNYKICDHCEDEDCNLCGIIDSIARVEVAISHILNAEGEKIQKVVAQCNDFDQIMCVNKEVNKTITNITQLEQVLYAKLQAVLEYCNCENTECKDKYDRE